MKSTIEEINTFCQSNKISVVEGNPNSFEKSTWIDLSSNSVVDFLGFTKNAGSKVIVMITIKFNQNIELIEYLDFNSISDEEEIKQVNASLNDKYIKYEGETYIVNMFFPLQGAFFSFTKKADWYNDFISELEEYGNSKANEEQLESTPKITFVTFDKLVNQIASSSEFFAFHTRPPRIKQYILKVLDEEKIDEADVNIYLLEREAIKLFERKFRTQLEKDFKEQIQILKKDGKTKKAIIGILQITEGIYDNLAY